ncbi:putative bifunctional diguanylate cyclase/phosphodiesterase [Vallicoccus soli]|uniref:putative bifunctional diguanylate cyclase/phosphodiesterase n=1 Tax=Vallicoccus soli TaxID=2339232 RepID=UPI0010593B65|nr:bifunctional diguanylate cyclase/phosphodiesterase [Vallicoccus soli]
MRARPALLAAGAAAASLAAVAADDVASYLVRALTAALAAGLLLAGGRASAVRPGRLLLAGALLVGMASGVLAGVQAVLDGTPPVGGAAAVLYLGYAPLAVAGLVSVPWVRADLGGRLRVLADAAVAGGALWYLVVLAVPADVSAALTRPGEALQVVYVVLPALVVATALGVLPLAAPAARPFVGWAAAGMLVLGAGDVLYAWQLRQGTYAPTSAAAVLNQAALLVLAVAALRSRGVAAAAAAPPARARALVPALLPYAPLVLALGLSAVRHAAGAPAVAGLAAPVLVVATGVLVRHAVATRVAARLVQELADEAEDARRRATTDEPTGLANRVALAAHLDALGRDGRPFAFVVVDVVGFRTLNDNHGHEHGDALLRAVAGHLVAGVPGASLVARVGTDQFAVVVPLGGGVGGVGEVGEVGGVGGVAAGERAARDVTGALPATLPLGRVRWPLRVCVGVVLRGPGAAPSASAELLVEADLALRRAKHGEGEERGAAVHVLDGATRDRAREASALREALADPDLAEFDVHYQPVVDAVAGRVRSLEALLRWTSPVHGPVSPAVFVPLAREVRSLGVLTDHVLDRVARDLRRWHDEGAGAWTPVAVNLTAADVTDPALPCRLAAALDRHGVPAGLLHVELTEDGLLHDFGAARRTLAALQERGVRVAVDDFGTGWSSLRYLRRLQPDAVKLDREFVQAALHEPRTRVLVAAVADLAARLGLDCVAEGVETADELDLVTGVGIRLVQGYHFSRPVPAAAVPALVASLDAGGGVTTPAGAAPAAAGA